MAFAGENYSLHPCLEEAAYPSVADCTLHASLQLQPASTANKTVGFNRDAGVEETDMVPDIMLADSAVRWLVGRACATEDGDRVERQTGRFMRARVRPRALQLKARGPHDFAQRDLEHKRQVMADPVVISIPHRLGRGRGEASSGSGHRSGGRAARTAGVD